MRPLGAQISHMLKDRGVRVIFGIPGVHNQEMYRGIEEAGLTHILARHEQGAGFMADGYARATGQPGVAYVISGPGLTNIMTPMGQAYSDSVPMLVISSCLDETAATRGQLHQMQDQRGAAATVCDWSEEARTAEAAYALIDRALMEFQTSRNRPKHVQIPIAQLEASATPCVAWQDAPPAPGGAIQVTRLPSAIKSPSPLDALSFLAIHLMRAERPLMIFGGGVSRISNANHVVKSILETCKAASFTTYAGRGVVPPDTELFLGSTLARSRTAKLLDTSDCVVVVGSDLAEVDIWRRKAGQRPGAFHINIDSEVLASAHPKDWTLQYNAVEALFDLKEKLTGQRKATWSTELIAGYRDQFRAEVDAERPGIVPVADALRECLPQGTMIYSDMTQFAYSAKEVWDMDRPGHWHHPTGFGTLGYALPAAIGGAVGRPDKPTLAIAGDYGFQYTIQELATAVELELSLPIFLWDNTKLGEIEASMVAAQIAPNAVTLRNPDFCKLAEAYGAASAKPETLDEMQAAVRAAFSARRPTLILVRSDIAPT